MQKILIITFQIIAKFESALSILRSKSRVINLNSYKFNKKIEYFTEKFVGIKKVI